MLYVRVLQQRLQDILQHIASACGVCNNNVLMNILTTVLVCFKC
jgi:hypothetical protein